MRISDWISYVCTSDLEDATAILEITSRAVGTVRNGYAVGGAHTPDTPTLHLTSKALTLSMAGDVDQLPSDKMVSRKLGSDVQQRVIGDTEFSTLQLEIGRAHV